MFKPTLSTLYGITAALGVNFNEFEKGKRNKMGKCEECGRPSRFEYCGRCKDNVKKEKIGIVDNLDVGDMFTMEGKYYIKTGENEYIEVNKENIKEIKRKVRVDTEKRKDDDGIIVVSEPITPISNSTIAGSL